MYLEQIRKLKRYRTALIIVAVAFLVFGGTTSFYIYDYTEHNPKFCVSCHIMKPAFESWEQSIHTGIECHDCHYATIFEKNRMLFTTFFQNPEEVSERPHDKIIVPGAMCLQCHRDQKKEGPKITESSGHARHWFKEGLECTSCHAIDLHKFEPKQELCVNCHAQAEKIVSKMKHLPCTNCHDFRKGDLNPKDAACLECHLDQQTPKPVAGGTQLHNQFTCRTCHKVHQPDQTPAASCSGCHTLAMQRGKHPVHLNALGGDCMTCHERHVWRITPEKAKTLCSQCHQAYPLKAFY